jgi:hypothetical protein
MKLVVKTEIEVEVSDFYDKEDAIILTKTEVSNALKGLCIPESVKFIKNFVDTKDNQGK